MALDRSEMLALIRELRALAARDQAAGTYEMIDRIAKAIQDHSGVPAIAAQALDVRFRAEDVYARPHLMPEALLRERLKERLQRLEATVVASTAEVPLVPVERRSNDRAGRRASDRLAAWFHTGAG